MQRARDQLLAGSALAAHEHVRVCRRRVPGDLGLEPGHGGALADDLLRGARGREHLGERLGALVALGALERRADEPPERHEKVQVGRGEAGGLLPVVHVEEADGPRAEPDGRGHGREHVLAAHGERPRLAQRVPEEHRLPPAERALEDRAAHDQLPSGRRAAGPLEAPRDPSLRVAKPHQGPLAAEQVEDRLEHPAQHRLRVAHGAHGAADVVEQPQAPIGPVRRRQRADGGHLLMHDVPGLVCLVKLEQHAADLDPVAGRELSGAHPLAVDDGAVPRARVAHLPGVCCAGERGVLARDLVVLEDQLALLVAAGAEAVPERHRHGHPSGLAHDEVGHGAGVLGAMVDRACRARKDCRRRPPAAFRRRLPPWGTSPSRVGWIR